MKLLIVLASLCLASQAISDHLTVTPMLAVRQGNTISSTWTPVYSGMLFARGCGSEGSCGIYHVKSVC
jgi:hypothetical protein